LLDPTTQAEFEQQFRAVQVLYVAMMASLAGYLVIGLALGGAAAADVSRPSPLIQIFYLVSLGLIVAAFSVKKLMIRPITATSSPEEVRRFVGSFRSSHLVTYALCEGIGVLGLVAFFVSGSRSQFINLLVVAFALMILFRPKRIEFPHA
jgi:hypothetical protein